MGVVGIELPIDFAQPLVHGIRGRHGRQSEVDAICSIRLHQAMGEQNGRFRFPRPGHIFEDEQLRTCTQGDFCGKFL